MKKKSKKQLESEVTKFNALHPVGSKVLLTLDSHETKLVTVKHRAAILGGHSSVGWFEEICGCYDLSKINY